MGQHIAGWILLILGVGFLVAGLIGAFKTVLAQQTEMHRNATALNLSIPTIPGFSDLLKSLVKQKVWGPIAALGLFLAIAGAILISTGHGHGPATPTPKPTPAHHHHHAGKHHHK
jgi:hypothetical protein